MKILLLLVGGFTLGIGMSGVTNPPKEEDTVDVFGIHHTPYFNIILGIIFILVGLFYDKIKKHE